MSAEPAGAGRGTPRALVIGVGNPLRGDDDAGPEAARRLRARGRAPARVAECGGGAAELLAAWHGEPQVWVVDAVASGAPPGTVHRLDAREALPPGWGRAVSTHGLGLAEAVELARRLGQLPARLVIYAIEVRGFEPGAPLSAEVERAVDQVVARIEAELGEV
ncbi:MAG TPA: hydrogenase maturation protease [Candidatus Saccharimonadales bacterium]|nr:hydrogenase maturation protease [Candidatus Saccharimonadales bacterium]